MSEIERTIKRIEFTAVGATDLSVPENMRRLLEAIDSSEVFCPNSCSSDERKRQPYDRERAVTDHANRGWFNDMHLNRNKAPKYTSMTKAEKFPGIDIWFNPKIAKKHLPTLLNWLDNIVAAFKPDYAVLTFLYEYEDRPYPIQLDEDLQRFLYSSVSSRIGHSEVGPSGLGQCTWLGHHYLKQIGKEHLESTPNVMLEQQAWGGTRILLGQDEQPWQLSPQELVDTWRPAMEHLWLKDVFKEQYLDENGDVRTKKSPNVIIGGEVEGWI